MPAITNTTICPILVETRVDLSVDQRDVLESSKHIDHANSSDRKWLTNHIHWAMRNHRVVTLSPSL